jgi:hypothetical protein
VGWGWVVGFNTISTPLEGVHFDTISTPLEGVHFDTILTPFRRHFDAISTPFRHHFDTISTSFRHHFDTISTPFRHHSTPFRVQHQNGHHDPGNYRDRFWLRVLVAGIGGFELGRLRFCLPANNVARRGLGNYSGELGRWI